MDHSESAVQWWAICRVYSSEYPRTLPELLCELCRLENLISEVSNTSLLRHLIPVKNISMRNKSNKTNHIEMSPIWRIKLNGWPELTSPFWSHLFILIIHVDNSEQMTNNCPFSHIVHMSMQNQVLTWVYFTSLSSETGLRLNNLGLRCTTLPATRGVIEHTTCGCRTGFVAYWFRIISPCKPPCKGLTP